MALSDEKLEFIQAWGGLATQWGINKTMGLIHGLLLVSPSPMNADDIMESLSLSRGNVNMNVRNLIDWGLVDRISKKGERKEFFSAEKNMWSIASRIIAERQKREIEPLKRLTIQLKEKSKAKKEVDSEFVQLLENLEQFTNSAQAVTGLLNNAEEKWFFNIFMKWVKSQ